MTLASAYVSRAFWITGAESASARVGPRSGGGCQEGKPRLAWAVHFGPARRGNICPNTLRVLQHFWQTRWRFHWIQVQYWKRYPIWLGPAEAVGSPSPFFFRYVIKDYAWGDPGDTIAAGQRKSFDEKVSVIPEAGSLGLLALGAAGLEAWRNARGQAPTGN